MQKYLNVGAKKNNEKSLNNNKVKFEKKLTS